MKKLKEWFSRYPMRLVNRECIEHNIVTHLHQPPKTEIQVVKVRPFETTYHHQFKRRCRRPVDIHRTSWLLIANVTFKDSTALLYKREYWASTLAEANQALLTDLTQLVAVYTFVDSERYGKARRHK